MKDRYLYKAKRLDNGEWVQGVPFEIEGKTVILIKDNENLLRTHYLEENMWTAEIYAIEVDSYTICQCTGLRDKNGKLIWENDVIKVCWQDNEAQCEEIAQVAWDEFGYYPWLDEYHCDGCDLFNEVRDIEVIGSIFDNPELLESEE